MEKVRSDRTIYRAKYIPIDELYTKDEIGELVREFTSASNEKGKINIINISAILSNMNFESTGNNRLLSLL